MSVELQAHINTEKLKTALRNALKRHEILCPLLSVMHVAYDQEGIVDDDLSHHVSVLMSEVGNYLREMENVLEAEEPPF